VQFDFKQQFYFISIKDLLCSLFFEEFNLCFQTSAFGFIIFNFKDSGFTYCNKYRIIGYGELRDGLYYINLHNNVAYNSMYVTTSLKKCVMNEKPTMLWHRRLGHISIDRTKRLVNEGVLSTLDFADFETCLSYSRLGEV
jgi:hypothetical protein